MNSPARDTQEMWVSRTSTVAGRWAYVSGRARASCTVAGGDGGGRVAAGVVTVRPGKVAASSISPRLIVAASAMIYIGSSPVEIRCVPAGHPCIGSVVRRA